MKKLFLCVLLFSALLSKAQMVGSDAFFKGNYIELGISGWGFEGIDTTVSLPLPGMHHRSGNNYFGVVANPQKNSWSGINFDGDFFATGAPENGWGFKIDITGAAAGNNCNSLTNIPGAIVSYSHTGGYFSAEWDGSCTTSGTDLSFRINYLMADTALFYTTTVSITNHTSSSYPDLFYYRNFDPDNDATIDSSYATINKIESQPFAGGTTAQVSASQSFLWKSYVTLIGADTNWRADYGGFFNRDASDLWYGTSTFTQTPGAVFVADDAISLAYRVRNFVPGTTRSFTFLTVFDTASVNAALNSLLFLDFPGENDHSSVVPDTIQICGSDSVPVNVNGPTAGDYSWHWSPATGLSDTTGVSVVVSPAASITYTVTGTPLLSGGTPDTMLIAIRVVPPYSGVPASLTFPAVVCETTVPILLSGGSPAGGVYDGPGIYANKFHPAATGGGDFIITYTVSDTNNCKSVDSATIHVNGLYLSQPAYGTICDNAAPFVLNDGYPSGGIYTGGPYIVSDSILNPSLSIPGYAYIYYTVTDSNSCVGTDTAMVIFDDCSGISENIISSVSIYPNPASGQTTVYFSNAVDLQNVRISLTDILGREITYHPVISGNEFKIPLGSFRTGIYILKVMQSERLIQITKLVVD
ncbi:MAG: T9SS type A sorting domain-containing protein [Bacteroidia bacterium]